MVLTATFTQPWNSISPTLSFIPHCKTRHDVDQIHARLIASGIIKNPNFTPKLILKFCSSSCTHLHKFAHHLLSSHYGLVLPENDGFDPFLFNAVIKAFAFGDFEPRCAVMVFVLLLEKGFCPDKYSFSLVLKACSRFGFLEEGVQIHGLLRKSGIGLEMYLQNCLISLYAKCGRAEIARQVFDKMSERDSVSYNAMIDGYVKAGLVGRARELFDGMAVELRNLRTWNCMIGGYVQSEGNIGKAWELFETMPRRDLVTWNLMIDGHVKCRKMDVANYLFCRMPERDVISWATMIDGYAKIGSLDIARDMFDRSPEKDIVVCNAMMAGYVQNGNFVDALNFFHNVIGSNNSLAPDKATLSIVLSAIAQLGRIDEGVAIHSYIQDNGFKVHGKLGVALIDMYSKCGDIESAIDLFESLEVKEVDHWNAMIGGFAIHGLGELAFELFMEMHTLLIKPDDITFIGVLNSCGHAGLVKEGQICFELMRRLHNVAPKLQHYGCMVDILCRAGQLNEAKELIDEMPIEPNDIIWRTMLSACIIHENFYLGKQIAEHLIKLDINNPGSYVLLSNLYAGFGMWGEVSRIRAEMGNRALKKLPGCSSIDLNGVVVEFLVGDQSHPLAGEVFSVVDGFGVSGLSLKSEIDTIDLDFVS
ncbi:hypothetical protein vseg_004508 [Gypsophila vaccaria]